MGLVVFGIYVAVETFITALALCTVNLHIVKAQLQAKQALISSGLSVILFHGLIVAGFLRIFGLQAGLILIGIISMGAFFIMIKRYTQAETWPDILLLLLIPKAIIYGITVALPG